MKTLIRLLLQKQSDLGLHCLTRPFCPATSDKNFRTFSVFICNLYKTFIYHLEGFVQIILKLEDSILEIPHLNVCLFDLILYVPVNNFSVMSGQVVLGRTSTKQG